MTTPLLKSWTPSTTYEFKLVIGDEDYSNDLVKASIRSSTLTPYQNVLLDIFIDPTDMITRKIYGETKITFTVILKGETQAADELIVFDLMFLRTKTQYPMQRSVQVDTDQRERKNITIETLVRSAYKTMTTIVNDIFYASTPEQIITSLVNSIQSKPKLEYDTNGKNTLKIDQFLIPPSTLYQTIMYLDRTYGVFNGTLSVSTNYKNEVTIENLSKKIQSGQALTVYQLATDADQSKVLQQDNPTEFYTKQDVSIINRGNSIMSLVSPINKYIVKPRDALFKELEFNTVDVGVSNAVTDKRMKIKYDSEAISTASRQIYNVNQTGYDSNTAFALSDISTRIQDVSVITIGLQHNLPILNLLKAGSSVNFIPLVAEYKPFGGMYVLRASDIGWVRSKVWESWATLYLMRSNISNN